MAIKNKAALKMSDFGSLRDAAKEGNGKRVHLAWLIVAANGIIERTDPTGNKYYGLKGSAEAAFPNGDTITADAIYLPPVLLDPIKAKLAEENAPRSIEFAFDIGAAKGDGDGYVYDIATKVKPRPGDPLAVLRETVNGKGK